MLLLIFKFITFITLIIQCTVLSAATSTSASPDDECDYNFVSLANKKILDYTIVEDWLESMKKCLGEFRNTETPVDIQFNSCNEVMCSVDCTAQIKIPVSLWFFFFFKINKVSNNVFLFKFPKDNTCGFTTQNGTGNVLTNLFLPEWSQIYRNGINEDCMAEAREKAFKDIDAQRYSCNSVMYYFGVCVFKTTNILYEAYEGCLKLESFPKNKYNWIE